MGQSLSRAVEQLDRDIIRTLGVSHRATIDAEARLVADLERSDLDALLVEHVQQCLPDIFLDATWPACPRHRQHPLWYEGGAWWCTQDHVRLAPLGEVSLPARPAG